MNRQMMLIAPAVGAGLFGCAPDGYGPPWGSMMWGGGFLMMIFWLIIIAVLVILVASLMRGGSLCRTLKGAEEKPLDILKKRYARGDITKDEFERMKKDIET
ncbi:MAG: SHOCT domain-containing protein [Smithellaceae bacterium]|nr:SHOCT domain-containing protein [Smithellaceae bacterium]